MVLKINEKYIDDFDEYQGTYIFHLVSRKKQFQFRWFTDCGEWFLYIHIRKLWVRFSSAGFIKGRIR